MSKLIVSQFKDVPPDLGTEVDRALDLSEIDAEFARLAGVLNGGLGPENLKPGLKFSTGTASGSIPNAWLEKESVVTLSAGGLSNALIVGVAHAAWRPLCFTATAQNTSTIRLYTGASGGALTLIASLVTAQKIGDDVFAGQYTFGGRPFGFTGTTESFSLATIPAGNVLVALRGAQSNDRGWSAALSLAAPHIG